MINEQKLVNGVVYVSVSGKFLSRQIPTYQGTKSSGTRLMTEKIIIYEDDKLAAKVNEVRKFLSTISKNASLSSPENNTYPVSASDIPALRDFLDKMDTAVELDMQEIEKDYDLIKKKNLDDVKKSIESLDKKTQDDIIKRAEAFYPDIVEIKTKRRLAVGVLTTATAESSSISNLDMLSERIKEDVKGRFYDQVFRTIDPIYTAVANIYSKINNGIEVETKSINYLKYLIGDICKINQGTFDEEPIIKSILDYLVLNCKDLYEDDMVSYYLLLNIYKLADKKNSITSLSDLTKMEKNNYKMSKKTPSIFVFDDFQKSVVEPSKLIESLDELITNRRSLLATDSMEEQLAREDVIMNEFVTYANAVDSKKEDN